MGDLKVHHCRFFHFSPKPVQCMSYESKSEKLAVVRTDADSATIDIWNVGDGWFLEQTLLPVQSIESVVWCGSERLFSAGLHGQIHEHCLHSGAIKASASSYNGGIWCLQPNKACSYIAAGAEDGCVVLFAVMPDGIQYERSLSKQESRILTLAWCDGDAHIVTGGLDSIRLWSIESGIAIQRLTVGRVGHAEGLETVIWSLVVLQDMTIVSGDSRGRVCFWNGRTGTLIKSFKSHDADIYTLCSSTNERSIFASGADSRVVRFNLTTCLGPNSDWPVWVTGTVKSQHTHDVRALCCVNTLSTQCDYLVSAGLDCELIVNEMKLDNQRSMTHRLSPLPQTKELVQVVYDKNVVMLQYPDRLELWKLGTSDRSSDIDGEMLKLSSGAVKLLELKVKGDNYKYHIVCSAISQSLNYIAYCDSLSVHLYSLTLKDDIGNGITVTRIKNLPADLSHTSAHCLLLTHDMLITAPRIRQDANAVSCMQLFKLESTEAPQLIKQLILPSAQSAPNNSKCLRASAIHMLRVDRDSKYLAVGRLDKTLHLVKLRNKPSYIASIPSCGHQVVTVAFCPTSQTLIAAYSDRRILEYSMNVYKKKSEGTGDGERLREVCEYSDWARKYGDELMRCRQFKDGWNRIVNISYHPLRHQELFLLHDPNSITFINKRKPMPDNQKSSTVKRAIDGSRIESHALHKSRMFKYIMYSTMMTDGSLLVMERTPKSLADSLPPAFNRRTKFGL